VRGMSSGAVPDTMPRAGYWPMTLICRANNGADTWDDLAPGHPITGPVRGMGTGRLPGGRRSPRADRREANPLTLGDLVRSASAIVAPIRRSDGRLHSMLHRRAWRASPYSVPLLGRIGWLSPPRETAHSVLKSDQSVSRIDPGLRRSGRHGIKAGSRAQVRLSLSRVQFVTALASCTPDGPRDPRGSAASSAMRLESFLVIPAQGARCLAMKSRAVWRQGGRTYTDRRGRGRRRLS
jgi:hypothetical protein